MIYKNKKIAFSLTEALVSLVILGVIIYFGTSILTTQIKSKQRNLVCQQGGYRLITSGTPVATLTLENIERVRITIIGNGGKGGISRNGTGDKYDYRRLENDDSPPDNPKNNADAYGIIGADGGVAGTTEIIEDNLRFVQTTYNITIDGSLTSIRKNRTGMNIKAKTGDDGERGLDVYKREIDGNSPTAYTTNKGSFFSYGLGQSAKHLIGGNFGNGSDGEYRDVFPVEPNKGRTQSKGFGVYYDRPIYGASEGQQERDNPGFPAAVLFEWPTTCIVK